MRRLVVATFLGLVGCNGIAGIADLRTGDLDGGQGPDSASVPDGSAPADAGSDADAEPGPPPCPSPQVGLRIAVLTSSSHNFTAVTDGNTINIAVGDVFARCLAPGTQIQLQAVPDDSNATHDWGGVCPAGRRCQFTLNVPTSIDVVL